MVMIGEDVGPTPTVFFIGLIVYSFDYLEEKKQTFLLHMKAIQANSMWANPYYI